MSEMQRVTSPVSELEYVLITGEGRANQSGRMQYSASVVLDEKTMTDFVDNVITPFWEANRPRHIKEWKSNGVKPHKEQTGETDEDGQNVYKETGNFSLRFSTGTTWPDGNAKIVKTFNAKGAEVALGDKKIGNGSRGRIQGNMAIYEVKPPNSKRATEAGVTFYLEGVQLSKFVEYTSGAAFSAMEDEDGGDWEGPEEVGGIPEDSASDTPASTPRL